MPVRRGPANWPCRSSGSREGRRLGTDRRQMSCTGDRSVAKAISSQVPAELSEEDAKPERPARALPVDWALLWVPSPASMRPCWGSPSPSDEMCTSSRAERGLPLSPSLAAWLPVHSQPPVASGSSLFSNPPPETRIKDSTSIPPYEGTLQILYDLVPIEILEDDTKRVWRLIDFWSQTQLYPKSELAL